MNRLILIALAALLLTPAIVHAQPREQRRPNIILLLADDQRFDTLGCYGNKLIRTPNIDALAAQGVRFPNAFVTTSICMSSRASIFTGLYTRTHGINDFQTNLSPALMEMSYPIALRKAGYRTGFIGKYGVGNAMPEKQFDYWRGFPGQGRFINPGRKYLTAEQGDQAVEFIRSCSKEQPFCLSVSFKAPHVQDGKTNRYPIDPEMAGMYDGVTFPLPENYRSRASVPRLVEETLNRTREGPDFTRENYQDTMRRIATMITGIDNVVGQIVTELKARGLADNTVILYTSDNGFMHGEHGGLGGKWLMYEESMRVPMVLYDPRLPEELRGIERSWMVLNIDLAPTIYELAGLEPPPGMQGRSLIPLIRKTSWRAEFFYEHTFGPHMLAPVEGIRTEQWKYVRYLGKELPVEQLFDLANDPAENHDLAADPAHRRTLDHLRSRWQAWRAATEAWQPAAGKAWADPTAE